jgi:hypothetical protein
MVIAIRGATVLSEYEGAYTCGATYKRRCEGCGYTPPTPPICVSLPVGGTVAYGTYHKESFVCPFCGSRQVVQLQG